MPERCMGLLDELWCFHHVREGNRGNVLVASDTPVEVELSDEWKARYSTFVQNVKSHIRGTLVDTARRERSVFFDVLFKRCIPNDEIWAGYCLTDGHNLRMPTHDPTICVVPTPLSPSVESFAAGVDKMIALDFLKLLVIHEQSFCSPHSFARDAIGETSRMKKGQTVFEEAAYQTPGSGRYTRNFLGDRKLKIVKSLPSEATRRGIYKSVARLDDVSSEATRDRLMAMSTENGGASIRIAGDDPGIRFAQAIHVNDPPQASGYLSHFMHGKVDKKAEAEVTSEKGSSHTFLIAPHALAEISRQASRFKQRLRRLMPIETVDLLKSIQQQKVTAPHSQGTLTGLYNMVDVSLKASRNCCHSSFRAVQQARRFHDKVARQFEEMLWPRHSDPTIPRSPLLFAIFLQDKKKEKKSEWSWLQKVICHATSGS